MPAPPTSRRKSRNTGTTSSWCASASTIGWSMRSRISAKVECPCATVVVIAPPLQMSVVDRRPQADADELAALVREPSLVDEEHHRAETTFLLVRVDERCDARDHVARTDGREVLVALAAVQTPRTGLGAHPAHPRVDLGVVVGVPRARVQVTRCDEAAPPPF